MERDRIKWNQRYESEESFLGVTPSPFLRREIGRIVALAPGKRALDIACGEGRNSVFLAQHGFQVTGLDISDVGIAKARQRAGKAGVTIDFRIADLDDYRIRENFDLIINFNFLLRSLVPEAFAALADGGLFILDTIMDSPDIVPARSAEYLLHPGELRRMFEHLGAEILFLEESGEGQMPTARILVRKAT